MFKVGDKVRVVNAEGTPLLRVGEVVEVLEVNADVFAREGGGVNVKPAWGYWKASRFELVGEAVPVALPFVVGAVVECLVAGYMHAKQGNNYIVESVKHDALGAVNQFRLEGLPVFFIRTNRFKVIEVPMAAKPFNRDEWEPQTGDKVVIARKWTERENGMGKGKEWRNVWSDQHMDEYVGSTQVVSNVDEYGVRFRNINFYWPLQALDPVGIQAIIQPPAPKPPPPVYDDLRDELIAKQKGNSGLCSFAFEYADGERKFFISAICHAALSYSRDSREAVTKLAYNLPHQIGNVEKQYQSGHNNCATTVEHHNRAIDYLINRSPWAVAFLTKDINKAVEKGMYLDVQQNKNVLAAACVTARSCMEQRDRSTVFCDLVDEGISENAAFLMAMAVTKDVATYSYGFTGWGGGHDILDRNRDKDEVFKFFKMGFHTKAGTFGKPFSTHGGMYEMAGAVASVDSFNSIGDWFRANIKATITGEGFYKTSAIIKQDIIDAAKKLESFLKD